MKKITIKIINMDKLKINIIKDSYNYIKKEIQHRQVGSKHRTISS